MKVGEKTKIFVPEKEWCGFLFKPIADKIGLNGKGIMKVTLLVTDFSLEIEMECTRDDSKEPPK